MSSMKNTGAALGRTSMPLHNAQPRLMSMLFVIVSVFRVVEVQANGLCKRGSCTDMPLWRCYDTFLSGCNDNEEAYVFSGRGLSGTIPLWLSSLSNAQNIYLDGNQLTGTIPDIFDKLPFLENVDVARNLLTGVPPASLCGMRRLSSCALRQHSSDINSFSCLSGCPGVCANVGCLDITTPHVAVTDVCISKMACGNSALAECAFLSCPNGTAAASLPPRLILSNKKIYGTIPSRSFAGISNLVTKAVRLDNNQLSGTVPDVWHHFPSLTSLDLSFNSLTGTIPASFASLSMLKALLLEGNQLTGLFPKSLCNATAFSSTSEPQKLALEECALGDTGNIGTGNDFVVDCSNSECLQLTTGPCSLQCDIFPTPTTTSMAHTRSGTGGTRATTSASQCGFAECRGKRIAECALSPCVGSTNVSALDLSGRGLSGTIPATALAELLPGLTSIDIGFNQLSGSIPDIWSLGPRLLSLQLHHNQLSGMIPSSIGSLAGLRYLDLSNNTLSQALPVSLCSLQHQFSTDGNYSACRLSSNHISCDAWIDSLGNPTSHNVCGSWFIGECGVGECAADQEKIGLEGECRDMPLHLCRAAAVDVGIVDLTNRRLFGTVPQHLLETNIFSGLELSGNQLSGTIPSFSNGVIRTLRLDDNLLTGTLPSGLRLDEDAATVSGTLPSDRSYVFDLSGNFLTGTIPTQFFVTDPSLIRILDFSDNLITGTLPAATFCGRLFDSAVATPVIGSGDHFCSAVGNPGLHCSTTLQNMACGYERRRMDGSIGVGFHKMNPNQWCGISCSTIDCVPDDSLDTLTDSTWCSVAEGEAFSFEKCPLSTDCMTSLRRFDVAGVSLTGSMPQFLGSLSALTTLRLEAVQLTGSLPSSIGSLHQLRDATIVGTLLSGSIDPILRAGQTSLALRTVRIVNNRFETASESSARSAAASGLEVLAMDGNRLSFDVDILCPLGGTQETGGLHRLSLSRNRLTGSIDSFYCQNSSVYLSCDTPSPWPKLRQLDLSDNKITGTFPPTLNPPRVASRVSVASAAWGPGENCVRSPVFPSLESIDLTGNEIEVALHRLICTSTMWDSDSVKLFRSRERSNYVLCDDEAPDKPGCYFPSANQSGWVYGNVSSDDNVPMYATSSLYCGGETRFQRFASEAGNCSLFRTRDRRLYQECNTSFSTDAPVVQPEDTTSSYNSYNTAIFAATPQPILPSCAASPCGNCSDMPSGFCSAFAGLSCYTLARLYDRDDADSDGIVLGNLSSNPCLQHRPINTSCNDATLSTCDREAATSDECTAMSFASCDYPFCFTTLSGQSLTGPVWNSMMWDVYGLGPSLNGTMGVDSDGVFGTFEELLCAGINSFDWGDNDLSGSLPAAIGSISTLTSLRLHDNKLSGLLPASIQSLSRLVELDLRNNSFTGQLPLSWTENEGMITDSRRGGLTGLRSLQAGRNNLEGFGFPSNAIQFLSGLEVLDLHDNKLKGTLPAGLGSLHHLLRLNVLNNSMLTGVLPASIGSLTALTTLKIPYLGDLLGTLPVSLSSLTHIRVLSLQEKRTVPWDISMKLCPLFQSENLTYCNIGTAGTVYCSQVNVSSKTAPCGRALQQVCGVDITSCKEIESCEQAFRLCYGLQSIVDPSSATAAGTTTPLESPVLQARHPYNLGVCDLQSCVTSDVKFELRPDDAVVASGILGTIPPDIQYLKHVTGVEFKGITVLSGTLPSSLGSMIWLSSLEISGSAGIWGTIPSSLGSLSLLQELDFRDNGLSGTIPPSLASLSNLRALLLEGNTLSGTVPASFRVLDTLGVSCALGPDLTCSVNASGGLGACVDSACITTAATATTAAGISSDALTTSTISPRVPACNLLSCRNRPLWKCGLKWCGALKNINLDHRGLSGTVPLLHNLPSVKVLDLSFNQLTGGIPQLYTNWSEGTSVAGLPHRLTVLNLQNNYLSGTLPRALGSLTDLRDVNLRNNWFNGTLPATLCQWNTPWLERCDITQLHAEFVCVNGAGASSVCTTFLNSQCFPDSDVGEFRIAPTIPATTSLSVLRDSLEACEVSTTTFPQETVVTDDNITTIFSAFPDEICADDRLLLSACVDASLENCTTVLRAARHHCRFGSALLVLRKSGLTGTIPGSLFEPDGVLRDITWLDLSDNSLTGTIPASIHALTTLRQLSLFNNAFEGTIPLQISSLSTLEVVQFHDNSMSGVIPDVWNHLPGLTHLQLSDNFFSGSIPDSLCEMPLLSQATCQVQQPLSGLVCRYDKPCNNDCWLGSTCVSSTTPMLSTVNPWGADCIISTVETPCRGSLTSCFAQCSASVLSRAKSVGETAFGTIPANIGNFSMLSSVDLHDNFISGTLPSTVGSLASVTHLDLSINNLRGTVPPSVGSMRNLAYLQLSHNELTGPLLELSVLKKLEWLQLAFNGFTGSMPASIGSLRSLQNLALNGNQLSGSIPASLCSLSALVKCELPANLGYDCTLPCAVDVFQSICGLPANGSVCVSTTPSPPTTSFDPCPQDPNYANDVDSDSICGSVDSCPFDAENDLDGDGVCQEGDTCPLDAFNDADSDAICGNLDSCPLDVANDADSDALCGGPGGEDCPEDASNADPDSDNLCSADDSCPLDARNDADGDLICGDIDSCASDKENDLDSDTLCADVDSCPLHLLNDRGRDGECDGPTVFAANTPTTEDPVLVAAVFTQMVIIYAASGVGALLLVLIIVVVVCCCCSNDCGRSGSRQVRQAYYSSDASKPVTIEMSESSAHASVVGGAATPLPTRQRAASSSSAVSGDADVSADDQTQTPPGPRTPEQCLPNLLFLTSYRCLQNGALGAACPSMTDCCAGLEVAETALRSLAKGVGRTELTLSDAFAVAVFLRCPRLQEHLASRAALDSGASEQFRACLSLGLARLPQLNITNAVVKAPREGISIDGKLQGSSHVYAAPQRVRFPRAFLVGFPEGARRSWTPEMANPVLRIDAAHAADVRLFSSLTSNDSRSATVEEFSNDNVGSLSPQAIFPPSTLFVVVATGEEDGRTTVDLQQSVSSRITI